ncbi:MAG: adenylate/guanylate cyclase domain-containing protein [Verrucomicrobia bacterium]|nr:adenylate/guanylate cyclase domain-containing protein [Verrucomicrobiota bacterium]
MPFSRVLDLPLRLLRVVGRLHLGLYFFFALLLGFSGILTSLFEEYSILHLRGELLARTSGLRTEREKRPVLDVTIGAPKRRGDASRQRPGSQENIELGESGGRLPYLLLVVWMWPLYRHYFRLIRRWAPPPPERIAQRIVDLPLFAFALVWVTAAVRYFDQITNYRLLYGEPDGRIYLTLGAGALLFGTFGGYLVFEFIQMYSRRFIARPYFQEVDPYGLKHGLRLGLTTRYALLLFSLGVAPLALCVYVPALFNWPILQEFRRAARQEFFDAHSGILLPLIMVTIIVAIILVFQVLSLVPYRANLQAPLARLIERMRAVARGDFETKLPVLESGEIGQLKGHFNLMLDGLRERDRIKDTFGRHVSVEIAQKILQSGAVKLEGEIIEAAVLFSDIRNFTPLSEGLTPGELIKFLNDYFGHVTRPIMEHGGVINKFIGDAVMAVFTPALGQPDYAGAAVRAALGMRAALAEFNARGVYAPVGAGVGVHCGTLVAGEVGTERRTEYTVLGDTVNVAARIESETKGQGTDILVSDALLAQLDEATKAGIRFVSCGPILMKGKSKPLELWSLA